MEEVVHFKVDYDVTISNILMRLQAGEIKEDKTLFVAFKEAHDEAIDCIKQASLDNLKNKVYSLTDFLFRSTNMINILKDGCYEPARVFTVCHLSNLTNVWEAMKNNDEEKIKEILMNILNDDETNHLFFPFYREIVLIFFK